MAEHDVRLQVALQSLPERWQTVLWHADVQQESPGRIGPLMGINVSDVPALVRRAREGLRRAYSEAKAEPSLAAGSEEGH